MKAPNNQNIGILTFHDGLNHGAYLQAYATYKLLESWGYAPEIINYKNPKHAFKENIRPWLMYRRPIRFVDHWRKSRAFKRDHLKLRMSAKTCSADDVKAHRYDTVVIGSDVVWNYKPFGYDDLYFGGVNANKIIAYAASCGWVSTDEEHPPDLKSALSRFTALSVRDANTSRFVQNQGLPEPPLVLDPTLVYDFKTELASPFSRPVKQPYILVYTYVTPTEQAVDEIRQCAKNAGLILVGTGYHQDWCDVNLLDLSPLEWIHLILEADSMITSTFHGAIFALKLKKDFRFIANDKAKSRVQTLFDLYGVSPSTSENNELIKISFSESRSAKIDQMITFSRDWLEQHIEE